MNIANNIIRQRLRNVYFICGGSCGGKSTVSKIISEKHRLKLYPPDDYKATAKIKLDNTCQPNLMNDIYKDPEKYYAQHPQMFSEYINRCNKEISEIVVADLLSYSKNERIIVDAVLPISLLKDISDYDHVFLLFTDTITKKTEYFLRKEKQAEYELLKRLPNSKNLIDNYLNALTYDDAVLNKEIINSGFMYIERKNETELDETVKTIERHFGLE